MVFWIRRNVLCDILALWHVVPVMFWHLFATSRTFVSISDRKVWVVCYSNLTSTLCNLECDILSLCGIPLLRRNILKYFPCPCNDLSHFNVQQYPIFSHQLLHFDLLCNFYQLWHFVTPLQNIHVSPKQWHFSHFLVVTLCPAVTEGPFFINCDILTHRDIHPA